MTMALCAVSFCKAKKPPFHPFPKNDQQLFDIWKGCVSNFRFRILTDEEIARQYVVCDDHFVDSCKIPGTNNLKKCSIPTLNVSGFKTNSNLNIAYNLYIEKQENDPINRSIKNINLDHNYVDKIFIDYNARIGNEDLDNCTLINLNPEPKVDLITKIWVDQDVESVIQDASSLDLFDPLSKNIDIDDEERNQDVKNLLELEIITMQNITDPLIIQEVKKEPDIKSVSKNDSGLTKPIPKTIEANKATKSHIKCSVPGCKNRYGSFHKFPTNTTLSKKWTDSLGITSEVKDLMRICSLHFKKSDYFAKFVSNGNSRRLLKKTAIPFNTFNGKKEKLEQKKINCAANICFNNNIDHKKKHYFPFPADGRLARTWAKNAEREDLILQPKFHEKNYYLCSDHFEKKYFKNSSKSEHRSDITVIPTVFNVTDCLGKPGDLYSSNLFMQPNKPEFTTNKIENHKNNTASITLQTYVNDSDISKITFDDTVNKSSTSYDYGGINYSYTSLYEDFVSNPGVLNLKPQPTDKLFKKEYCRLCARLCSVAALVSIFDKGGNLTVYGKMVETCLPGKVHAHDKLPHWMCSKCEYKLDVCCSSIEAFIAADNQLRDIFSNNPKEAQRDGSFIIDRTEFLSEISLSSKQKTNDNQVKEQTKVNIEAPPNINMPPEINKIIDEKQKEENNKYQCLNCDQLFNTKKELVDHSLAVHNSDKPKNNIVCKVVPGEDASKISKTSGSNSKVGYSKLRYECVICSSLHEKKDSLIKHSLRYHSQSGNNGKIISRVIRINNLRKNHLTCLRCKEEFRNFNSYRKHMKKQHLKLNCEQCGKQFTRNYKLLAHVKLHEIKSVVCPKCPQVFQDKWELLKHQVTHKFNTFSVRGGEEESSEFSNSESLKNKKKNERSLCNICGKLFPSSSLLKYHLESHSDVRSHQCSICSKAFQTLVSLKRHKKIHSPEKRCICQICGKQFGYLSVLRSHMFSHSTHRPHVCELCGAGFHRRNNLKKHLTTHEKIKENEYECKTCHSEFNNRVLYIRHKREHSTTVKKSFSCDICSKIFLTKYQMQIHRRIHTGETPFDCEQCGKSFRSRALLKQHRLIHMNVFPHSCNFCDRKFRRLQSLVVHRRTHTGEKPYPCPFCGRAFANRSDMNKHKHNLHIRKNKQQSVETNEAQCDTDDIENVLNQEPGAIYAVESDHHLRLPLIPLGEIKPSNT